MSDHVLATQPGIAGSSTSCSPISKGEPDHAPRPEIAPDSDAEGDEQPQDALESYDWHDLADRYQRMVQSQNAEEVKLWHEYDQLAEFFSLWGEISQTHEVDRATKRMATRMQHVQHSEAEVEAKRQHYARVVEAFESALRLLNAS